MYEEMHYDVILIHVHCRTAELQPICGVSIDSFSCWPFFHHKLRKN